MSDLDPIPWLESFLDGLDAEFHARHRIAALATVDPAGQPCVRSVICRRFNPDGSIDFATDVRSQKMEQIRHNPRAELMFWLPGWREQYRLAGRLEPLPADQRRSIWAELSDKSRALFAWPAPARPRQRESDFAETLPASHPLPDSFLVLRFVPDVCERLELNDHPHRRRRWRESAAWRVEELNP